MDLWSDVQRDRWKGEQMNELWTYGHIDAWKDVLWMYKQIDRYIIKYIWVDGQMNWWISGWMDLWSDVQVDRWKGEGMNVLQTYGHIDAWMHVLWMYGLRDGWMHVYFLYYTTQQISIKSWQTNMTIRVH